ncbi:TIGR02186 family protein [Roseisalinus antarcticus]|uniref:Putative transmembrane protein (Alph_Pro_TM) n=1 Tax=Roseisalinus antarcticus TaxID=254357 RepID=A0A1Y5RT07_9RHOB|nr:TIGR02186 family protein [Roseisalinus antarcticus]SLN23688.1 Putative transmembrane protein (Alph_Pro_TM) [Roseisalinus antarcticus]
MIRLALLWLALVATPARAEEVVLGLSQDEVSITATFDGSEILIFGAVKRDAPIPAGGPLSVIVTVQGPREPVVVRRKDRVAGIWVNTDAMPMDLAPSFYAVATTGPFFDVISHTEDLRHQVSIEHAIRAVGDREGITDPERFRTALIRIRTGQNLYQQLEGAVEFSESTLFNTSISLPANLTEGAYATRIFLTRDGAVVDTYEGVIQVQKVGLERFLFNLAQQQPLAYGLLSLFIAITAGWGASAAFRALKS